MAVPTLVVELSLASGDLPTTENPTWTDISTDVRSVNIRRGRDGDFDTNFRSSATLVLENKDRTYDPFNANLAYASRLTPRRQIRIRALIGGNYYPLFRGLVNGFPVVWDNAGKESTITVECLDYLSLLAVQKLKGDFADLYTKSLSPVHYFKCNEPSDSTTIKDYGSAGLDLDYSPITPSQPKKMASYIPLGFGLKHNSANIEKALFDQLTANSQTTGLVSVSLWTAGTGQVAARHLLYLDGVNDEFLLAVSDTQYDSVGNTRIQVILGDNLTTYQYRRSTIDGFNSTVPNHVCATYDSSSGVAKIYVNGVDVTDTSTGGNLSGLLLFPTGHIQFYGGIIQEVAVFDKILTQTEITNLYQFGQGNQTETTTQRMQRLANLTDLPAAFFNVSYSSFTTMSGIPDFQSSVLDAMLKTQATEGGYLFCDKSGVITATARDFTWTSASSLSQQLEIADDGVNPAALKYTDTVELYTDGDNIRNDVTVNYSFGAPVNAFNQTSIDAYGLHSETIDAQNSTFAEANDLAYHYLNYFSLLVPTLSPIEIGLNATTQTQWETILGLELLDRYKFIRTPSTGSQYSSDMMLNYIEYDLKPKIWSVKVAGSSRFTYRPPTVGSLTFSSLTQNSVTVSANVNANGSSTAVTFEYSTSSTFASVTSVSATPSTATGTSDTSVSANITGLSPATTYYYRCKAVSTFGTVYASGSFTTWGLKTVTFTGTGTWSPASGVSVSTISSVVAVGGGGGSSDWAGGGGGQVSQSASMAMSSSVSVTIGAGGAGGSANGTQGGTTTVTASTSLTATGGYGGNGTTSGGTSGSGTYAGGSQNGGGGGQGGAGQNGTYSAVGGNGGDGVTVNSIKFSGGGGGAGTANGSGSTYDSAYGQGGGAYSTGFINIAVAGQAGYARFQYYGPTGSRSGTGWTES